MSDISAPGENGEYGEILLMQALAPYAASKAPLVSSLHLPVGFIPTFGPSFINMYGSPREMTGLFNKYEYLDKGKVC